MVQQDAIRQHSQAYDTIRSILGRKRVKAFSFKYFQSGGRPRHRLVLSRSRAAKLGLPSPVFEHHDPQEVIGWLRQHLALVSAR